MESAIKTKNPNVVFLPPQPKRSSMTYPTLKDACACTMLYIYILISFLHNVLLKQMFSTPLQVTHVIIIFFQAFVPPIEEPKKGNIFMFNVVQVSNDIKKKKGLFDDEAK